MKTFRFERTDHGYRAFVRRGNAYVYFGHFLTQRAAREAWDETLQRHDTDHAVIWSVFHDSYIVQPLPRIGALELKYTGTRDECNAWIAQQR